MNSNPHAPGAEPAPATTPATVTEGETAPVREVGGREGPEPTRYGDWEMRGRCIDF